MGMENWQFKTIDARVKLKSLYPRMDDTIQK